MRFEHLTPPTDGQPITMTSQGLRVPDHPVIPFIYAAATGPDQLYGAEANSILN